jgi:hypothetical protein
MGMGASNPLAGLPLNNGPAPSLINNFGYNPASSYSPAPSLFSQIAGPMLGGAGAGFLQQPVNTTSSGSGSNYSSAAGGSTTSRTLTPYQTSIQGPLFDYIRNLMTNP